MSFTFEAPDEETYSRLIDAFPNFADGFVRCQPGNLFMPGTFQHGCHLFQEFKVRPDDTWVVTFPRCGTTWTQEMVWLICNNCDFEGSKKTLLRQRFPFLEERFLLPKKYWGGFESEASDVVVAANTIDVMPSPRFIKTHLPFSYLPPNLLNESKVVYVARNPKDVAVSCYFHTMLAKFMTTTKSLTEYAEFFLRNETIYAPYSSHVLEAWAQKDQPNVLFLFFEDMKRDLGGQIEKVAAFLGKELSSDQVSALTEHLTFRNFQQNPSVNARELQTLGMFNEGSFIRKGEIGDWKNYFDDELSSRFDRWIQEQLAGSDFKFPDAN